MINDLDNKIERYISLNGKATAADISHAFKLPRKEARRRLERLVRQGYINRV